MMPNVLSMALTLLPKQKITYQKYLTGRQLGTGFITNTYAPPITVEGSIQPASADTYYKLGLANTADIFTCVLRANVLSVAELQSNDIIIDESGQVYNVFKSDKWSMYPHQDWNRILLRRAKQYGKL